MPTTRRLSLKSTGSLPNGMCICTCIAYHVERRQKSWGIHPCEPGYELKHEIWKNSRKKITNVYNRIM